MKRLNGCRAMDEMMLSIAREYFASMGKDEKKEILHTFLDMLSAEEKEEVLKLVLKEFSRDKNLLKEMKEAIEGLGK